jgi:type IV conjugative transfer system coupling protein TraD
MSEDPKYAKMFTRGGQITFNNLRMLIQVNQTIVHGALILTLLVTACCIYLITPALTIKMAYYYYLSELLVRLGSMHHVFSFMWQGSLVKVSTLAVLEEQYFREQANIFMHDLKIGLFLGVGLSIVLIVIFSSWLIRRGRKQAEKKYVRGAKMDSLVNVAKAIRKHGASDIVISDLPMVKNFEVQHVLIHGTTGSGKGQTFNQFIEQIRERKDSAIIFDKGCVFTSSYYNYKTDVILNPFDTRCAGWDLWAEAKTEPDFENIAASLIPMHGEGDPYWVDAARTVFSATAYRMRSDADRSLDKLLSLILTAELDVLGDYLKGTQAATLVSGKIEKTAISIRSVISTYLKSLRFMQGLENREKFAIRDWINQISDATSSNFLFISSNAEQHASIRPLISTWLSIASIALLSLDENFERRIWFICDELPTLHKLPQLGETIAEVRKFGGCFILGMQSISQLQKIYGRSAAAEMFDLLNTRFFYRSPSSDMANVVSKELGQEDIELSNESYSYGSNTIRDGISIGDQRITRPLVTPAEIMELPDLTAYVRVPAPVPITKIAITYTKPKRVCAGFILREELRDISEEIAHNAINNTDAQNTDEVFDTSKPEVSEHGEAPIFVDIDTSQKTKKTSLDVSSKDEVEIFG